MEMAKTYDPKQVEDKWYARWLEAGYFQATPGEGTPYCITIPPPNVTGSLHMGHALNNTILDAMTRWHRMRGFNALCLPGTDHAGIATQNVVERELAKEGLTRHDIGREAFIERCWAWRRQYGDRIYLQLQKLGCSYDWERARFTMDESYVEAIYEEFIQWWERGLIYRGARVVNWCPRCRSAISDIEVDSEERAGSLWHIRYPIIDDRIPPRRHEDTKEAEEQRSGGAEEPDSGSGFAGPSAPAPNAQRPTPAFITVATTRPETMLGDTAVAVNPADERYSHLIGARVRLPLTGREIPIVADEHVRVDFGTGAVKVTPAHDLDDFEIGVRHNLPQIVVIGEDGSMTEAAGARYAGLDRFEARDLVVADLTAEGLLEKIEPYTVKTPLCDRCGTVLEPLLSEQWFARMKPDLAGPAIQVVKEGKIRFIPERYERIYLDWMEKIQPWCLSRQLWWGHRIPVWWTEDRTRNTAARSLEDAAERLGVPAESLTQDEDVLDTWFSSALWPHATLGWPRQTEDLKFWYPTDLLSTAQEILYLWVARMIMTGLDFIKRPADKTPESDGIREDGQIAVKPFKDVYVHATILDEKGERMSKSKGNGVDPLDMIDAYGADALRFALMQQAGMNQDFRFSEERIKLGRNFCNKLWNASRFVVMTLGSLAEDQTGRSVQPDQMDSASDSTSSPLSQGYGANLAVPHRWILSRLERTIAQVNAGLASYDMDDAMRAIYTFFWDEYCDWYLEIAKRYTREDGEDRIIAQVVLGEALETTLRLLHPVAPFITEEIWQTLREAGFVAASGGPATMSIMHAHYPVSYVARIDESAEEKMALVIEATRALRNLRSELRLDPGVRLLGAVVPSERSAAATISNHAWLIADLARLSDLQMADSALSDGGTWVASPITGAEVFLEIGGALDVPKELERIDKEVAQLDRDLEKSRQKLENPQFVERAPAAIVERERAYAGEMESKRAKLLERRALLAR